MVVSVFISSNYPLLYLLKAFTNIEILLPASANVN